MRRMTLTCLILSLLFAPSFLRAEDTPTTQKTSGSVGAKAGSNAGKKGGIYVVGRGFKTAGHEMKDGFKAAGRGIEKGGRAAGRAFQKAGREIKEFFTGE